MDDRRVQLRVSLDIDVQAVKRRLLSAGLNEPDLAPIPLVISSKELQLDLDLHGSNGESLSIATSDCDSHYSHAYVLKEIVDLNADEVVLTDRFQQQLYDIIRGDDGVDLLLEIINAVTQYETGSSQELRRLGMQDVDARAWNVVFGNDDLFVLVLDLSVDYFMIAFIPTEHDFSIIKYRRLASWSIDRNPAGLMGLGLKPSTISVAARGIGSASREHTRIVVPPGMRVVDGMLLDDDQLQGVSPKKRVDSERLVIYTSDAPPGNYFIRLEVYPYLGHFFIPALICSLVTFAFSSAALFLEYTSRRFTVSGLLSWTAPAPAASADASAALLALVPTAFAVFLIQNGEHRLISKIHTVPRLILLACALLTLFSAGAIAISAAHELLLRVLAVTAVFTLLSSLYFLAVPTFAAFRRFKEPMAAFMRSFRSAS